MTPPVTQAKNPKQLIDRIQELAEISVTENQELVKQYVNQGTPNQELEDEGDYQASQITRTATYEKLGRILDHMQHSKYNDLVNKADDRIQGMGARDPPTEKFRQTIYKALKYAIQNEIQNQLENLPEEEKAAYKL